MAINFPNSPSTNDTHSHNGLTYIYDGTIWKLQTLDTTTSNEIIPYAYAHVRLNTAGTGTNMSWGAYNSSNGDMVFTFNTALSDNLYYVLAEREQYDTHTVSILSKSTTGFTARWLDNQGTGPLSPDMFPGVLIVYASDPTKAIGGVGGGGDRDRIIESDTSVECIDDGTGDRIVFKTAATEAVQIDANRQILISGTETGNNVAKIYNSTDGLSPSTGILGIFASSNNATPRDVRFYSGGGTANEIFRIGKDGQIGVGGDVGTAGEVLTSGGPSGAATWSAASGGGSGLQNIVEDLTPQLGDKLDTNTHNIDFTDDSAAYFGGFSSSYGSGLSIHHDPNNVNGNVSFIDDRSYNGLHIMYGTSTDSFGNYVSKVLFKQRTGNGIPAYDLKIWNSGVQPRNILDKDTQAGTAGQVLSATGLGGLDGLDWITPSFGLPMVNVADFGALPSASGAANRTGIEAAINSLASTGGMVYIPTGTYDIDGTILLDQGILGDGGGISIIGATQNYRISAADAEGTLLRSTDPVSDIFKVNNVRNVTFANLAFDHKDGTPRNGGNAIHCYSNVNTQQIRMDRIYIRNQFGGIKMDGHSISTFRDIEIRDIVTEGGSFGMLFSASAGGSERVDQIRCENVLIDGVVDGGGPHPTAIGLWVKDFVNSIWFLNCVSNRCDKGFLMDATVPSGDTGNPGSFFRINDCDFDTNNSYGIEIAGGSFIWINNPYISSNLINGLRVSDTFTGVLRLNAADCRGNGQHGIYIRSSNHKKIHIRDSQCSHNSASSSNQYDGLHIRDGNTLDQSDIMVDGGQYGGDMMGSIDTGSSTQRYGINFSLNVKYKRIIINNVDCSNNQTGSHQFTVGNGTDNMIHNVIPFHGSHAGAH
tara:strand:- start:3670 stop:6291 length:2622 start_codon:yes stop_codon:yes gene_type:complete